MIDFKTNEIYEFIAVEKRYNELGTKIENACQKFCEKNIQRKYLGWGFNDRQTLIEITYSYVKHGEEVVDYESVSFDEIINIINEDSTQIK